MTIEQQESAIRLLKNVYSESTVENEYDYEIFLFLKEIGELDENAEFYSEAFLSFEGEDTE